MARKCILIFGMHRSGTSALAGAINHLGFSIGKAVMPPKSDNPKGFYENLEIQKLNDNILSELNSSWDDVNPLKLEGHNETVIQKYYSRAKDLIFHEFNPTESFIIKDPRISLLFPFWEKVCSLEDIPIFPIIMLRPLDEIATSLKNRNNFSIDKSVLISMKYLISAISHTDFVKANYVEYLKLVLNPKEVLTNLLINIEYNFDINANLLMENVSDYIVPSLKHHSQDSSLLDDEYGTREFYNCILDFLNSREGFQDEHLENMKELYYNLLEKHKLKKVNKNLAQLFLKRIKSLIS